MRELWTRIAAMFRKRQLDSDLDIELQDHIERAVADNLRRGLAPAEARRQAMIALGGYAPAKELHRDARGLPAIDSILQDLRYTLRTLKRDAGFTTFAVLIVGLGIGASSTVFSLVNALLLRPLPFKDPAQLVWVMNEDSSGLSGQTTQVNYLLDLRAKSRTFSDVAGYFAFSGVGDNLMTGMGEPERLSDVPVTENFFRVLGVEPLLGRTFTAEECKWRGPKAVMLHYGFWQRRFAGDPSIVGRTLTLNQEPHTVVGVLPPTFDFAAVFAPGSRIDLVTAFPLTPETNRWGNTLAMIGKLKPGETVASARAELAVLAPQLVAARPDHNGFRGFMRPLPEHVSRGVKLGLLVLAVAVGVVMLIVCANLSNLLLARTASRQREMAIRTALGAGRGRLVRQMLTEGIVLSGCGALLGVAIALGGTRALTHLDAFRIPLLQNVRTDAMSLGFILATAIITGIVFGLAPALQAPSRGLHDILKDSSRGSTEGRRRAWIRSALVVSEVAFACVLLVGAGLLIRSFQRVLDVNIGFRPENAAALRVDPDRSYNTQVKVNAYIDDVLRRVKEIPGVAGAGMSDALPLGRNRTWGTPAKGQTYKRGEFPSSFIRIVSDGYLGAMGIPLREGRDISPRDTPATQAVIVINESMARRLFPNGDAMGSYIRACGERQVVGIAGDVRHLALEQGSGNEVYIPMRQCGDISGMDLVVRSSLPPGELASAVRGALKPIAPGVSGNDFRPLQGLVDRAVSPRRFTVMLLGGFALFALILSSLGIYGVISYSVNQRTQEIGIRMALGAPASSVQSAIVRQTLGLASIGMAAGTVAAWVLSESLSGLLFEVKAGDPVTFAGMLAVLTVVAAIAGYLPARRASRIDPTVALRGD